MDSIIANASVSSDCAPTPFLRDDSDDRYEQPLSNWCAALLDCDRKFSSILDGGLLSHEARLLLQLTAGGGARVKEAALASKLSERSFYELYRRLEGKGLLNTQPLPSDMRTKKICVTGKVLKIIEMSK